MWKLYYLEATQISATVTLFQGYTNPTLGTGTLIRCVHTGLDTIR